MTTSVPASMAQKKTPIQNFYSGSSIFITGGTGFLGKVLIEKLLRTCPDIRVIYLLIRDKRGLTAHQRVDKIFEDPLFEKLKRDKPNLRSKLCVIKGDCSTAGMGLTSKCMQVLINQVNIVFHVAATVKFDEKLRSAMNINVKGTMTMLDLCKKMHQLKSLVYVSTAYSNCNLDKVDEVFYDVPYSYEELTRIIEKLDDNTIDQLTPKILGDWPNTYTMTKAMAESVVKTYGSIPVGVFRPGIVVSTHQEPIPGWTDNYYGPTGVAAASFVGILRTMFCGEGCKANIVPVDMTVNALIACARDVANNWEKTSTPPIYNYVSNVDNPITWDEFNRVCKVYVTDYPAAHAIWPVKFECVRSTLVHDAIMLMMLFPAAIMDVIRLIFCFRKPILFKMIFKTRYSLKLFQRFSLGDWEFTNNNVKALENSLNEEDKNMFEFRLEKVNWMQFCKNYILGVRRYLIKEDDSNLEEAKKHQKRIRIIWDGFMYLAIYFVANWFMTTLFSLCSYIYSIIGF